MSSEFKPQAPPPPYPGLKSIATAPPPPVVSSTLTSQDKPAAVVENDEVPNDKVQKANTIINQDLDSDYVVLTIRIPGLQCKRKLNLSKAPKNGRLIKSELGTNKAMLEFVVNEGRTDEKTYRYENKEPFKGPIEPDKSVMSFDDNVIHWKLRKLNKWKK